MIQEETTIMLDELLQLLGSGLSIQDYQYYNHLLNKRSIVWNAEINEDIVEKVIIPLLDFEQDNSNDPVTLYLSTIGGSISDALVICNIIDNYKKPLNIIVLGYAASMGTIMLAAGAHNDNVTRKCYPFSYALLHAGFTAIQGESGTAKDVMNFNETVDQKIKNFILSHTSISNDEYEEHARKQWFLNAKEMKHYGFIDEIIGEDDDNDNKNE